MAQPVVGVIMGSRSDWETMQHACATLDELGVRVRDARRVGPPHARPDGRLRRRRSGSRAAGRDRRAPAGRRTCPGMTAAHTHLPVLGVPVESHALKGMDSLLSIVQMPAGVPVGTLAIGRAGAVNAALLAASIVALHDDGVRRAAARVPRDADADRARPPRSRRVAPGARRRSSAAASSAGCWSQAGDAARHRVRDARSRAPTRPRRRSVPRSSAPTTIPTRSRASPPAPTS